MHRGSFDARFRSRKRDHFEYVLSKQTSNTWHMTMILLADYVAGVYKQMYFKKLAALRAAQPQGSEEMGVEDAGDTGGDNSSADHAAGGGLPLKQ